MLGKIAMDYNLLNILCEWTSFLSELPWTLLNSLNSKALSYNLDVPKTVEYWQTHMKLLVRIWETKTNEKKGLYILC